MRAFVTGGTGFIGTHLVQVLDAAGWDVVVLRRATSDVSALHHLGNVRFALGDITDQDSLRAAMPERVDAVFHVAGSVENLPHELEHTRYRINQEGTRNVMTVCRDKQVGRVVYTTTVLTLDFRAMQPLTEAAPPNDWSRDAYIHSKRLADVQVQRAADDGLDVVFMHPSAIFGSYDKATWSKMFTEVNRGLPVPLGIPGGGSVCYVRDVAQAHIAAFHHGRPGEHYILGGPDVTWLDVVTKVSQLLGKKPPIGVLPMPLFKLFAHVEYQLSTRFLKREPMFTPHIIDIVSQTICSRSDKAVRELGYTMTSLDDMLQDCYTWMVDTGRLPPIKGLTLTIQHS